MPLIACPDCANQVSDQAPACPKCGRPRAATTIEQTGKNYKAAMLGGAVLTIGGLSMLPSLATAPQLVPVVVIVFVAGIGMIVYGRLGAWWANG